MKQEQKQYTPKETAEFKKKRREKFQEEKKAREPKVIWHSKFQGPFKGSIKKTFFKKNVVQSTTISE